MDQQAEVTRTLTEWFPAHSDVALFTSILVAIALIAISVIVAGQTSYYLSGVGANATRNAKGKRRDVIQYTIQAILLGGAIIPVFGTMAIALRQVPSQPALQALVAIAYAGAAFVVPQSLAGNWVELWQYDLDSSIPDQQAAPLLSFGALLAAFFAWGAEHPPHWLFIYVMLIVIVVGSDLGFECISVWFSSTTADAALNPRLRGLILVGLCTLIIFIAWLWQDLPLPLDSLGLFVPNENPIMYGLYVGALIAIGISVVLACGVVVVSPSMSQNERKQVSSGNTTAHVIGFSANADQVVKLFFFEIPLIYGFWVAMTTPRTMSPLPIPADLNVAYIPVAATCGVILHALLGLMCVVALICIWAGEAIGASASPTGGTSRKGRIGLKSFWRLTSLPVALLWSWLRSTSGWRDWLAVAAEAPLWGWVRHAGGKALRWMESKPAKGAGDDFLRSGVFMIALLLGSGIIVLCWEYGLWPIALLAPAEILLAGLAYGAVNHALSPQLEAHPFRTCFLLLGNTVAFVVVLTFIAAGHDIALLPDFWSTALDLLLVYMIIALIDALCYALLHIPKARDANFVGNPLRWVLTMFVAGMLTLFAATGVFVSITANAGLTGAICLEAGVAGMTYLFLKPLIDLAANLKRRGARQPETNPEATALLQELVELGRRLVEKWDHTYTRPALPTENTAVRPAEQKPAKAFRFFADTFIFACLVVFHVMFIVLGLGYFFNAANVDLIIPLVALGIGFYWPINKETDAERRNIELFFLFTLILLFAANALGSPVGALSALGVRQDWLTQLSALQFYRLVAHVSVLEGLFLLALGQLGYLLFLTIADIWESYLKTADDD